MTIVLHLRIEESPDKLTHMAVLERDGDKWVYGVGYGSTPASAASRALEQASLSVNPEGKRMFPPKWCDVCGDQLQETETVVYPCPHCQPLSHDVRGTVRAMRRLGEAVDRLADSIDDKEGTYVS